MEEKREYKRFKLNLEANIIYCDHNGHQKEMSLLTRDISCKGVFLSTCKPLELKTPVKMQIVFQVKEPSNGGKNSLIQCQGHVVRVQESQGMAVIFDKQCKLYSLDAFEDYSKIPDTDSSNEYLSNIILS